MRGEARVKAAQPTTDNRCWGLTEAGSAGDFCAHCQRFLPSITTTGASAASNPSNRRALTPMRRVLPSHFPSASNAGLSLNVVQPQWAQKRCATCRVCHHQVWRTVRVLAGIGSLRPISPLQKWRITPSLRAKMLKPGTSASSALTQSRVQSLLPWEQTLMSRQPRSCLNATSL